MADELRKELRIDAWRRAIEFARAHRVDHVDFASDTLIFGRAATAPAFFRELHGHLESFIPWRKGPFEIYGQHIEASWDSARKWDRIAAYLDPVAGKRIADVGSNNGYYMFRLLAGDPELVLGMDPVQLVYHTFLFLHALHPDPRLQFVDQGFAHLEGYENHFDIILNMGIIYHHSDPLSILKLCRRALKKGGQLVLETMAIMPQAFLQAGLLYDEQQRLSILNQQLRRSDDRGDLESYMLFPSGKYAGANGIWFLPTPGAIVSMLRRSGFQDISIEAIHRYDDEQRQTEWSSMPGLTEFLDPDDPTRTIEGYPAPVRIHLSVRK